MSLKIQDPFDDEDDNLESQPFIMGQFQKTIYHKISIFMICLMTSIHVVHSIVELVFGFTNMGTNNCGSCLPIWIFLIVDGFIKVSGYYIYYVILKYIYKNNDIIYAFDSVFHQILFGANIFLTTVWGCSVSGAVFFYSCNASAPTFLSLETLTLISFCVNTFLFVVFIAFLCCFHKTRVIM